MKGERVYYIAMKVKAWRTDDHISDVGCGIYIPYSVGEAPALHGKESPAIIGIYGELKLGFMIPKDMMSKNGIKAGA